MNWQITVRPNYRKYDYLKSILFCNFLIASAGTIYYKRYYRNKKEYNPYFLLLICYSGIYLNSMYMLPIDWNKIFNRYNYQRI